MGNQIQKNRYLAYHILRFCDARQKMTKILYISKHFFDVLRSGSCWLQLFDDQVDPSWRFVMMQGGNYLMNHLKNLNGIISIYLKNQITQISLLRTNAHQVQFITLPPDIDIQRFWNLTKSERITEKLVSFPKNINYFHLAAYHNNGRYLKRAIDSHQNHFNSHLIGNPVTIAVERNSINILERLLQTQKQKQKLSKHQFKSFWHESVYQQELLIAIRRHNLKAIKILVDNGAGITQKIVQAAGIKSGSKEKFPEIYDTFVGRLNYQQKFSSRGWYRDQNIDQRLKRVSISACKRGFFQLTKVIFEQLDAKIYISSGSKNQQTILIAAAESGNLQIIQLLQRHVILFSKEFLQSTNYKNQTALLIASQKGYTKIVKFLLHFGVNIQALDECLLRTPLMIAASKGYFEIVKILSEKAVIDARDKDQSTALILATQNGHFQIVKMLMEAGANVCMMNKQMKDSFQYACLSWNIQMVKYFFDIFIAAKRKINIKQILSRALARITQTQLYRFTTQKEDESFEVIKFLVENGADLQRKNRHPLGVTILSHSIKYFRVKTIQYLLMKNASLKNVKLPVLCQILQFSALLKVDKRVQLIQLLIQKGVDLQQRNEDEKTPLIVACQKNLFQVVELLVDSGADLQAQDVYQNTPLLVSKSAQITKYLLSKGANFEKTNSSGCTALQIEIEQNNLQIVQILDDMGANFQTSNIWGENCIYTAVMNDASSQLIELIASQVDINQVCKDKKTILEIALQKNLLQQIENLIRVGAKISLENAQSLPIENKDSIIAGFIKKDLDIEKQQKDRDD